MRWILATCAFCLSVTTATFAQDVPKDGSAFIERGMVEVANPNQAPCSFPDVGDGCNEWGGNTVWHDLNVTEDYYVSAGGGEGGIDRLSRYVEAAAPYTYEMRFTAEGGVGVYAFSTDSIAAVPFELWNIGVVGPGEENDPSDDFRMIPVLNANAAEDADWADDFTGLDPWPDGPGSPITDWVYWLAPESLDGDESYRAFEAAAMSQGGPGNVYPWDLPDDNTCETYIGIEPYEDCDQLADDGDTTENIDPYTGELCGGDAAGFNGYYADFCYRNQEFLNHGGPSGFIYPIGRMVIADFSGNGETPPTGTVIRIHTAGGTLPPVAAESGVPTQNGFALKGAYPNPVGASAVVPFTMEQAGGHVRIAAYDVLGREVAVLVDEARAAGTHTDAEFRTAGLPNGLYVLRATFGGETATQKVLVVR